MALGRHRARAARGEGRGAVFSGGVGCWRLRLRRTDCCYLPLLSWPCLGWTGGVGEGAPRRVVAALPQSRSGRGRLLPAAPAHPRLPLRSPASGLASPRWAWSGRRRGPLSPVARCARPLLPRSAGGLVAPSPLGGGVPGRLGPPPARTEQRRAGAEAGRAPTRPPSHSLGAARPRGWGPTDPAAGRAVRLARRGLFQARRELLSAGPGPPSPSRNGRPSTSPSPAGVRPHK